MGTRKISFVAGEHYHVYNRGVDKRIIFQDLEDLRRFLTCMNEFNNLETIGSIHENSFRKNSQLGSSTPKLVNIIAYCLNQNHYHFILEPLTDLSLQKFMHKISTGYTNYFNEKYKRSGALFQGRYKAKYINSNEYLLYLSVYVNMNDQVHKGINKEWMKKMPFSSFTEYADSSFEGLCEKDIILKQFKNRKEYISSCKETLPIIQQRKELSNEFADICID